ncbi:hypothetical protein GWK47_013182 [Chionoecetes opilio]|uniref:Uncharacterized protein n=1 Tax=Chionoecetes opilio TaxID=41210 RepID=A0A8J5CP30_CHIOP|nr:hypothetical protein GWK47_013182 [Chionoecetes opilio]
MSQSCVSTYTSEHHIQRYLFRQQATSTEEVPLKKSRRSGDTFIFREHCLFCGERCLPADPRNPSRWRTVIQCRTVDSFKQNILHKCDLHNDQLADNVRVRVNGVLSDLHAADTQYHEDCYKTFTNHSNVRAAAGLEATQTPEDTSLNDVIRNEVASILVFRSKALHLLKLVDDKDDTDVTTIAKVIKKPLLAATATGASNIRVVCDDTDVFILLIYFYQKEKLSCDVVIVSPVVIDIKATAIKHKDTADSSWYHAISGCDTTSYPFGIGKATALKPLYSGRSLRLLGQGGADLDAVVSEAR